MLLPLDVFLFRFLLEQDFRHWDLSLLWEMCNFGSFRRNGMEFLVTFFQRPHILFWRGGVQGRLSVQFWLSWNSVACTTTPI